MRTTYSLNALNWRFARLESPGAPLPEPESKVWQDVTLPHVWNKDDPAQAGCCVYQASFGMDERQLQKRHFIEFEAVAGVCQVVLNGRLLGEHRGGYSAFRFGLDSALQSGANTLTVLADNTRYSDINPLTGDFDNYGGIYRDVKLIEVEETHFDLLYYGTCGLLVDAAAGGAVTVEPHIVGGEGAAARYTVLDSGQAVAVCEAPAVSGRTVTLQVETPHLWDGKADPHCYTLRAELLREGKVCDAVELRFGFRSIGMDAARGFSLNGEHLRLNGVAKHQDRQGMGNAPTRAQLDEDMAILKELGANAVRLSHYQHPQYFYDLCDQEGLVVWAEIPMLAMPDGNDGAFENAKSQLTELILQNKHHPSICFWGIQNEIAMMGESLEMYDKVAQLNSLAKQLDPARLTTAANLYCVKNNSQLNFISDCIGYNLYYGWYYGEMGDYAGFIRKFRADNPGVALGFSEYGVDCNLAFHSAAPKRKDYSEEYQALYHETVYPQLTAEPAVWGSFVWNLFDFGSSIRDEGGVKGRNSKGLVTWDRQTKKDAFYYYKAQWSQEPFVHITGRRFAKRSGESTIVKVYSNCPDVTLTVPENLPQSLATLPFALACAQALKHGHATVPQNIDPEIAREGESFSRACGLKILNTEISPLEHEGEHGPLWTAPSPAWAHALALCACVRHNQGFSLNNPSILTELYPGFWPMYNGLPIPALKRIQEAEATKERRRIRTRVEAKLTPRNEDDE